MLQEPLLYLSLYFKIRRMDYYRLLQEVREQGAWEAWLDFFLDGVAETANQAFESATKIVALFRADRERIVDGRRSRRFQRCGCMNLCKRALSSPHQWPLAVQS